MQYLEWSEDLRVGVTDVDQQHQQLVSLVNELHTAMLGGHGKAALGTTIDGLVNYALTHFATEERYFDTYDYPDSAVHKARHRDFVAQVADFKQGFDEDRLLLSLDVMNFLSDWLVDHIKGTDKPFGPFLNERGVV